MELVVSVDPQSDPWGPGWCDTPSPTCHFSRYLMAAKRCPTPTLEALSTSSQDPPWSRAGGGMLPLTSDLLRVAPVPAWMPPALYSWHL